MDSTSFVIIMNGAVKIFLSLFKDPVASQPTDMFILLIYFSLRFFFFRPNENIFLRIH